MTGRVVVGPSDQLPVLREYRALAPWGLRDLTALAGAMLDASGVFPVSATARARPTERTVRFYVSRGLVSPPEGRGTAAVYGYRHLLQVLAIKLRQMEGVTLESIESEFGTLTGDVLERRVAGALGAGLPAPGRLMLDTADSPPRGKVGRVRQRWAPPSGAARDQRPSVCRRIPVTAGIELLIDEQHPVLRDVGDPGLIATRVREALLNPPPRDGGVPAPRDPEMLALPS